MFPYPLHRHEIPTEILLKMKLFRPKPATPEECFERILRALFTLSTAMNLVHRNSFPKLSKFQIFLDILLNFANFGGRPMTKSMQILEKRVETVGNNVKIVRTCYKHF